MKIKKGQKFKCIDTVVMYNGDITYLKDKEYVSELSGCLTNLHGHRDHKWSDTKEFKQYFEEVKTYTLTKEQLKSLTDPKIKEMFPEVFETVLEVGKWYKYPEVNSLCCVVNPNDVFNIGFGLNYKREWKNVFSVAGSNTAKMYEATPEEIETALNAEANKRGFIKGAYYKCLGSGKTFQVTSEEIYKSEGNERIIFSNGVWAEIVEAPLKIGTWYNVDNAIINYQGAASYGIGLWGIWTEDFTELQGSDFSIKEATQAEVFEALKNEAVKRYKSGDVIDCIKSKKHGWPTKERFNIITLEDFSFYDEPELWIETKNNEFACAFHKGKWAEIIPTKTKAEAEKLLNCKIID